MNTKGQLLALKFPDIAKEWDYEKNNGLIPSDFSYGSKEKVYWICPICKHSFPMQICNRTGKRRNKGNQCTVCQGRLIIPGFNSLLAKLKELGIENEWDYNNNDVDPDTIPPHKNKTYMWLCSNGHQSYPASPNNKISNTGGNCPRCSHQKISPEFSLASVNPELSKEWHPTRNGNLTPTNVFANTNQSAIWICEKGHEWPAKINNRNNGKGCKECTKGSHSSFPEQAIYYYLKKIYPTTLNGLKINKTEVDIFIPEFKVAIEYDGYRYHNNEYKLKKDLTKNEMLFSQGLTLIRIREKGCSCMSVNNCKIVECNYTSDYLYLNDTIPILIKEVNYITGKAGQVQVDIHKDRFIIKAQYVYSLKEKSLLTKNPTLSSEWDYKANCPATPEMYSPGSEEIVGWICHTCGLKWKAQINSRNSGCGCSRCAKRYHYSTDEWIKEATKQHHSKYDYSKVEYIDSKTIVTITCPKHGDFPQIPSEHLSGKGCKYCAGQAFHPLNSLAVINPPIAAEWDYEKNGEITPNDVCKSDNRKFYWKCNWGKPHSYSAFIQQRLRGTCCAVCAGRQFILETSLATLFPDIAKEWDYEKNTPVTPLEIGKGYDKDVFWKCSNTKHPSYQAKVYNRTKKCTGCKRCYEEKRQKK